MKKHFRVSLRYKLAFPVLVVVTSMLFLMFRATYRTVREVVEEHTEQRLVAIAEVFAQSVRVPLILRNQEVLHANIEWMAKRDDVLGVSVEDGSGVIMGAAYPNNVALATSFIDSDFVGVQRVTPDSYVVGIVIEESDHYLGRLILFFLQPDLGMKLRKIFVQRLLIAFLSTLFLAVMISGFTWIAILPLFKLKRTARKILAGDLSARAQVHSFDEIQDLSESFDEMVHRLTRSFENLRSRTEALEESEEKFRLVVESADEIIILINADGDILLLNKEISGVSRSEVIMGGISRLLEMYDEESKHRFQEAVVSVIEKKTPVTNLAVTQHLGGGKPDVYYLANLTPVLNPASHVKQIQVVLRDVTELRRIEMMKESLIRDVAHELKTPTSKFEMVLHWFEKDLKKNNQYERYKDIVKILVSNTDRLMRTINSIMDLTKLESGMDLVQTEILDLNDVLNQVHTDLKPMAEAKGIALLKKISPRPLHIRGDRDMVYRVFVNLISNSLKFTEKGQIEISDELQDGKVAAMVRDTGVGIEAENLEKIFERFVQKTAATVGIGVGLTICRDIMNLHHGRIFAESEGPGKGAVFKVLFPAAAPFPEPTV